jgi:hypothetical protein
MQEELLSDFLALPSLELYDPAGHGQHIASDGRDDPVLEHTDP